MVAGTARWCLLIWIVLVGALSVDASNSCSTGVKYQCPNCGGIEVKDCFDCDGFLSTEKSKKICFNRVLFQPRNSDPTAYSNYYTFLWNDLVAMVIWFFVAGVAIACGVGGGGIYVPLGVLVLQFSPKQASGLSQCSIFGATLGGLLLNVQGKHPNEYITDAPGELDENERPIQVELSTRAKAAYTGTFYTRPVIHYDMVLYLAPVEISGALVGVIIQALLPNWLYLSLAVLVLSFTSYKTYGKFWTTRQKEKDAERLAAQKDLEEEAENINSGEPLDEEDFLMGDKDGSKFGERSTTDMVDNSDESRSEQSDQFQDTIALAELRKLYLEADMRQFPKEKILALLLVWIVLFILTLLRGGKGVPSLIGITCESVWYSVLIAMQFTWLLGAALFFGRQLLVLQQERLAVRYPYQKEDTVWNNSALAFYGACTFAAGIIAGLIGIGGGMILGPLMLVMGIHPRVSTASTATMIVMTSSSVAVAYVISGLVPWSYALFFFSVCFAGAVITKSRIDAYIKRTGRASLLIFILATIIFLATIGCLYNLFSGLAAKDWCLDGFRQFCTASSEHACPVDRALSYGASLLFSP